MRSYWPLALFYFFIFTVPGALMPYTSLYFQSIGLSALEIGWVMAIMMAMRMVGPYVWGWWADVSGRLLFIIRLTALASLVSLSFLLLKNTPWGWVAIVCGVFSFFWGGILPQFEVLTLNFLKEKTHLYSRIRLWGSVGFVLSTLALGYLLQHLTNFVLIPATMVLVLASFLVSFFVPPREIYTHTEIKTPFMRQLAQGQVLLFLVVCFLLHASHGTYYTFYSVYLHDHHYTKDVIGWLWSLGVMAEIVLFWFAQHLLTNCSWRIMLLACLGFTVLRWWLISIGINHPGILIAAQCLHAVSFGLFHALAMEWVRTNFSGRLQARGQALYGSVGFGLGGVVGSWGSGALWAQAGGPLTFQLSAGLVLVAFFLSLRLKNITD